MSAARDEVVAWAVRYASEGMVPIPMHRPSEWVADNARIKLAKLPIAGLAAYAERWAGSETERVERLFGALPLVNLGIRAGRRSRVFVVDIDFTKGGGWFLDRFPVGSTRTVRTGRGVHLYFRYPEDGAVPSSAFSLAPGVDIMSDGSNVNAPPSLHGNGERYRWLDPDAPIRQAPDELLALARAQPPLPRCRTLRWELGWRFIKIPRNAAITAWRRGVERVWSRPPGHGA